MRKVLPVLALLSLMPVPVPAASGQDLPSDEQIIANIRYRIPELRQASIVMRPMATSAFEGLYQGVFVINDAQEAHFLYSPKTAHILLLLSPAPIDVGLSESEVAALQAEEMRQERIAETERHQALVEFADGMAARGPSGAPVTIFEFSDFQCPYCARGFDTMEELLRRYPDDVRFIYLHLPLPNHEWAKPAAIASVCAANQDDQAFWMLHDGYFRNQSQVTLANIIESSRGYLQGSGIDMDAWARCASDATSSEYLDAAARVEESVMTAESVFGVSGTPGFFVNGRFLNGARPIETFEALVKEIVAGQPGR